MGKASLGAIPRDHFGTMVDASTGRPSLPDFATQVLLPACGGGVAGWAGAVLPDSSGAVAGVSIVAGLLFSMAVFLFQLRLSLPDDKRLEPRDIDLVDQCMKNVLWAILWGMTLALFLVVCGAGGWLSAGTSGRVLTGIAIGAGAHFLLVIAMCLKRLRRAYERLAKRRP